MEAVFVTWHHVADDFQVAVVVESAFATVDDAVAIEVFVFHVARTIDKVVGLQTNLTGNTFLIIPTCELVVVDDSSVKVVFGEVSVGFKAPDISPCLTLISITYGTRMTNQFDLLFHL